MRRIAVSFCILFRCWTGLLAQSPSNFIPVTPCRVVDTRNANGPFGGPAITENTFRTFIVPSSSCNVPSYASAYSLNVTVNPLGTAVGYLAIWPAGQSQPTVSTLNDSWTSGYLANAAIVAAGTGGGINVYVTNTANVIIDINGYFVAQTASTSTALGTGASNAGAQNTAVGYNTLQQNSGGSNTAVGSYALAANASGNNNTALGASALLSNALGSANVALGTNTLLNSLIGNDNTAVGFSALESNTTGSSNVALGAASLWNSTSGTYNTGIGMDALYGNTTGSWNIGLGYQAGYNLTSGTNNIDVGNMGTSSDSDTIRIGTAGTHTAAYIAGINTSTVSGVPVVVNSYGQLGVETSSVNFKEDIHDMGNLSDAVMQLRPVIFRYRNPAADGSKPLHFGLIAEEVDKIYPELVLRDSQNKPFAIAYQELPALLLSEVEKQHRVIEQQQATISGQEAELRELSRRLAKIEKSVRANTKP